MRRAFLLPAAVVALTPLAHAGDKSKAREAFERHQPIALIVYDGTLPGYTDEHRPEHDWMYKLDQFAHDGPKKIPVFYLTPAEYAETFGVPHLSVNHDMVMMFVRGDGEACTRRGPVESEPAYSMMRAWMLDASGTKPRPKGSYFHFAERQMTAVRASR